MSSDYNESQGAYTQTDLDRMRGFTLQRKIQITTTRFIEWYNIFGGEIYLSFDGTPESRVLVDIGQRFYRSGMAERSGVMRLAHARTGAELAELDEYIAREARLLAAQSGVSIEYLEPEYRYDEIVKQFGLPVVSREVSACIASARRGAAWAVRELTEGKHKRYKAIMDSGVKVSPFCCDVLRERPYKDYESRTGLARVIPSLAEAGESEQIWMRVGCNSPERMESRPMSFWTRADVIEYANAAGIALPGFPTGCARCMYGKDAGYYRELYKRDEWWNRCVVSTGIERVLEIMGFDHGA
jgi:hypothetical protein